MMPDSGVYCPLNRGMLRNIDIFVGAALAAKFVAKATPSAPTRATYQQGESPCRRMP